MDDLKTTVETLSPEDVREFTYFIQRQKKKKVRKDYELFKLLLQKKRWKPQELMAQLYPEGESTVAYYALRKRLMQHLTDFIMLKRTTEDPTASSTVMGLLSLARYLFDAQAERLAWNMLRKAEKTAEQNEQYELLNTVYNLQIEKAGSAYSDDLDLIIQKRNENKAIADEDERANIASSIIQKRLEQARVDGRYLQFESTIQEVLSAYGLQNAISRRPSLLYKLMQIARSAVLARKDFYTFEPYIIEQYLAAANANGFSRANQYYKVHLLYMIAHVLYRNRKFQQSNHYLAQLQNALQNEAKSYYGAFYTKCIFLKSANDAFMRSLPEAIQALENLLQKKSNPLAPREFLTARLGLSFLYFAQGSFQKSNNTLLFINKSDKWCEKVMGKEWVLKKKLGELILQYEIGNPDVALEQIKLVKKNYQHLLEQPFYSNASGFLQLLEHLFLQPDVASRKIFLQQVEDLLQFKPTEQEDLPSMSYYAWLKSKMVNKSYYEVLLELAGS
ncbi:hypothetical protein [Rufibacter roseus]|uniref:Uncharacterized protein n=1 Tax=Rufibacter roseus TaxID=1567108 RepID=A0ABW2DTJ5_9BACT|nr:hypothetical protein [Rufibacter roseus]